jgi:hypothetical protein
MLLYAEIPFKFIQEEIEVGDSESSFWWPLSSTAAL